MSLGHDGRRGGGEIDFHDGAQVVGGRSLCVTDRGAEESGPAAFDDAVHERRDGDARVEGGLEVAVEEAAKSTPAP